VSGSDRNFFIVMILLGVLSIGCRHTAVRWGIDMGYTIFRIPKPDQRGQHAREILQLVVGVTLVLFGTVGPAS
jgi:hypothetical protein